MAQLDYSIGTARTPLNIQPGIQNYFQGQANRRQNQQAKRLAEADQKQKTIADFVAQSTTEDGELDRQALSSRLLNKGLIAEDSAIKSDLMKQDQSIAAARQKKTERDQKAMGALADFYLSSEDKEGAYQTVLETMQQERIPMPPNWGLMPDPGVDQMMEAMSTRFGKLSGGLPSSDQPSSVREYQYYNSLPPDEQARYLEMKRAQKTLDLGGAHAVLGQGGQITQEIPKSLRPGEDPGVKGRQAKAAEEGKIDAQVEGAAALREARGDVSKQEEMDAARTQFDTLLEGLKSNWQELGDLGGAVSTEKTTPENFWARLKSSDVGQKFAEWAGGDEQAIRQKINIAKPSLINLIRKASNMGAKGLDSEKELEFYLKAATNDNYTIEANIYAIHMLQQLYGEVIEDLKDGNQAEAGEGAEDSDPLGIR